MKRNSFLLFVAILFTSVSVSFAQKKLSILGDSYSTYYGYVTPDTNLCWYGVPEEKRENDVKRVEDTCVVSFMSDITVICRIRVSKDGEFLLSKRN